MPGQSKACQTVDATDVSDGSLPVATPLIGWFSRSILRWEAGSQGASPATGGAIDSLRSEGSGLVKKS